MVHLVTAMSRYGAVACALFFTAIAVATFIWMISAVAAALDSLPTALVVTTTVLLPPAYSLARLGQPRRR